MKIIEKAFAKLNLSIDVLSKMDDGYHRMLMVMQSADLYDDITITLTENPSVNSSTNLNYLPRGEGNIASRAASLFFQEAGMADYGAEIDIFKRIPVCAGLGGGSSDAAAVLRGLNKLTGANFGKERLCEIGAKIGSDVPFCVSGGTALAQGRGTELTALHNLPECLFVICKPKFYISTPEIFSIIDCDKIRLRPDTDGIMDALASRSLTGVAQRLYNVFEDYLKSNRSEIDFIKERLIDFGSLGASMSGTGSAVFGIFTNADAAFAAETELKNHYEFCVTARPLEPITSF